MKIVIAASRRFGVGPKEYRATIFDNSYRPLFGTSRGYATEGEARAAVKQLRHPSRGVSSARVVDGVGFNLN